MCVGEGDLQCNFLLHSEGPDRLVGIYCSRMTGGLHINPLLITQLLQKVLTFCQVVHPHLNLREVPAANLSS